MEYIPLRSYPELRVQIFAILRKYMRAAGGSGGSPPSEAQSALAGVRGRSPRENFGIFEGHNLEIALLRDHSMSQFLFGNM